MKTSALDIAKIIVRMSEPEVGDIISNLKLQKLLYYSQGFHLAMHDKELFPEEIEAWMYGPVVPVVYQEYRQFGQGAILTDENSDLPEITDEQRDLLIEVYRLHGQFSALRLMQLTHQEDPWRSVPFGPGKIITKESMRIFFKDRL